MNVVDQNEHDREHCREHHIGNRACRNQQQADREQASVDVEMPERVHEILQEERRARHEHEQWQMLFVKTERPPEELDEQPCRHQPHRARQREHQPHRHLGRKQRDNRANQGAFCKAEMIIDQQMDVWDVRRQRDLVPEHPDQHGGIDGKHRAPGVFP